MTVFDAYCKKIKNDYKKDIINKLTAMLKRVYKDRCPDYRLYAGYIQTIIDHFDLILELKMEKFNLFAKDHFSYYKINFSSKKWFNYAGSNDCYKDESFFETLVSEMRYNIIKKNVYIPAIKDLGIRTCIYCNAEYMPVYESGRKIKARCEADHFFPKDKYPFLCISFFNLLPSCPYCNKSKRDKPASFYLYTNNYCEISPFRFGLEEKSVIQYKLNFDAKKLKINIDSDDKRLLKNHNDCFHIENLYSSFKDEAEEIIWKSMAKNYSYMKQLKQSYKCIFGSYGVNKIRFLYGFYEKQCDVHKRPLSKMKQDIAKQLKILK